VRSWITAEHSRDGICRCELDLVFSRARGILAVLHWRNVMTYRSKTALIALAAVIAFGSLALAQPNHKKKTAANRDSHAVDAQRERAFNSASGSLCAPTYAVPNPNSPALTGGGSVGYNTNLYNW